ncbi:Rhodanese-related sulfurtransferase [Tistlia consotensis]|uniref:Rhodanese-related sulfurtransferase n=1 Tax=Tistlia consotensis USBA 355 TaxID=560819 RepID=A0A1Y6BIR8_9PROT|nr:rhodanese-like domain-containing protein [Tistlia consotensis]SMF13605.1 Rhodanese-related sulfurtransferase [Tistlia consotensis USBA 355]SNR50344.1 Rhodanese-related sulfurtransferase [Tistlia consotensis]
MTTSPSAAAAGATAASADYAGDLDSRAAHELLAREPEALLVDVRSAPEWDFVGRPDPEALGGRVVFVSWKRWPGMASNERFLQEVAAAGVLPERPLLLLCRSGQRSRDAAVALTRAGFGPCWNIADGFEGPKDEAGHRNTLSGWRAAGLPWIQG